MLEKLAGSIIIILSFLGLALISYLEPPTLIQIVCAFAGTLICLIGIVFLFAEDPILRRYWEKKAPKAE